MAIREIIRMGNPILATLAQPIQPDDVATLPDVIQDMIDTMRAANGVGLAAPQIGLSMRLIVFEIPRNRQAAGDTNIPPSPQVLINPKITHFDDEMELGWEGCLSIPGLKGEVPRHSSITYDSIDAEGNRLTRDACGFHARVIQHEIDHLDGVLFVDYLSKLKKDMIIKKLKKYKKEVDKVII